MMIDRISSQMSALSPAQGTGGGLAFMDAVRPVRQAATPDDFGSMITQMIAETADALHKAETNSVSAIKGQVPIQDVVESVLAAEQMLQAAIAVRDKVTAAYLELSRMGI